jgi:cytochrome c-type biogenesis protein
MTLEVSVLGAFVAGLLSFVSPCVLPLVPPYLAFIGGVSVGQLAEPGTAENRSRIVAAALAFVAGFTTVFVALGATASLIGQTLTAHLQVLGYVAGLAIIVLGLHFLGVFRIGFLDRTARLDVGSRPLGLIGAYVVGLAFAFGWSPCVGPVLAAILLLAGAEGTVGEGAWLLFIYALGLGVPFLIAAGFAGAFMRWAARFRSRLGLVEKAVGVFLIATGAIVFAGRMPMLANWLVDVFPALGRIG